MKMLSPLLLAGLMTAASPLLAADKEAPAKPAASTRKHATKVEHACQGIAPHLDTLGKQLHLKDEQKPAWTEYETWAKATFQQHPEEGAMMATGEERLREEGSSPERLKKLSEALRVEADRADDAARKTTTFYDTLSPEQKTIFDLHWRRVHPSRHCFK